MPSKREFVSLKVWMWDRPDNKDHSKDYIREESIILPVDKLEEITGVKVAFTEAAYYIQDKASKECYVQHWYITPEEVGKLLHKLNIL